MDTSSTRPRIRVLLADPERQLLSAYRQFLETQGFDVATASSREKCLSKLTEWKPDVLVIEPETPHHWGEEVIARLNQSEECSIPVLILSKRDRQSVAYPVREYHVKPFPMAELVYSIHAVVADPEWGQTRQRDSHQSARKRS